METAFLFILNNHFYPTFTSNRSKFITLSQAATKSFTNFSCASSLAYTSAIARSSELEPNTRSARVAVHFGVPLARSLPRYNSWSSDIAFQAVPISRRFTKKSLVSVARALGENTVRRAVEVGIQGAHATYQHRQFRRCEREQLRLVDQQFFCGNGEFCFPVIPEAVSGRF